MLAMEIASRSYVTEEGRIVLTDPADNLLQRPEIRKAFLGLSHPFLPANGFLTASDLWKNAVRD